MSALDGRTESFRRRTVKPARRFFDGGSMSPLLSRGVSLRVLRVFLGFLSDVGCEDLEVDLRDMTSVDKTRVPHRTYSV